MSFIVKEKSNFIPCPEGLYKAVCVDLVEMSQVPTMYGPKDMIRIVWEVEAKMDDGRPFLITNRYTPSLNPKANLRKLLKSWRGKDFTAEELQEFDLEKILGTSCQLNIEHNEGKDGNTYANISACIKAKEPLAPTGKYVRVKDRPATDQKPTNTRKSQKEEMECGADAGDEHY